MSFEDFTFCSGGDYFYECGFGANPNPTSGFLGCCTYQGSDQICDVGCPEGYLETNYVSSQQLNDITKLGDGQCDAGYSWEICQETVDWFFYGCFWSPHVDRSKYCIGLTNTSMGNATIPAGAAVTTAISFPSIIETAAASASATSVILGIPTYGVTSYITVPAPPSSPTALAFASPTSDPQKPSTGAIAGGAVGGAVGLAAIAALLGILILLFRRRKGRALVEKQLSNGAANGESTDKGPNQKTAPEDPTSTPAPAYSSTDPNSTSRSPNPPTTTTHPISEISTSDIPRPISEMASLDPADFPVRVGPARLKGTAFIPYRARSANPSLVSLGGGNVGGGA